MEWFGSFEIPGSNHQVGGRLVIDEHTSQLTVFGSLLGHGNDVVSDDEAVRLPMVRGKSDDGQAVTAVELSSLGDRYFMRMGSSWSVETWLCAYVVEGHFEPALGPVIARHRAPFSYSDDRFSSAVAGLESYSALRHGERDISKEERDIRVAVVKGALEQGAPDYVEWVLEALERAHRHTLRSRLDRLLSEAGLLANALVGQHREAFVSAVIRSRDQVAHSLERKGGLEGGAAMHWASRGFVWLLRYLAMIELGFSIDESRDRALGNDIFRQEANLLQQTLSAAETSE